MNRFSLQKVTGQNIAEMGLVCGLVFLSSVVAMSQGGSQVQQLFGHVSTSMTSALVSQGQQNQSVVSSETVSAGTEGHNQYNESNHWSELHGIPHQSTVNAGLTNSRATSLNSQRSLIRAGDSLNSNSYHIPHQVVNNANTESSGGMGSQNWVELNNWNLLQNHGSPLPSLIVSTANISNGNPVNPLGQTEEINTQQTNISSTPITSPQQHPMTLVQGHVTVPGVMGITPTPGTEQNPNEHSELLHEDLKHDDGFHKNKNTQLMLNNPNGT